MTNKIPLEVVDKACLKIGVDHTFLVHELWKALNEEIENDKEAL